MVCDTCECVCICVFPCMYSVGVFSMLLRAIQHSSVPLGLSPLPQLSSSLTLPHFLLYVMLKLQQQGSWTSQGWIYNCLQMASQTASLHSQAPLPSLQALPSLPALQSSQRNRCHRTNLLLEFYQVQDRLRNVQRHTYVVKQRLNDEKVMRFMLVDKFNS